ncbi:MAG: hypothetical protein QM811_28210 [Pirellulales bacterium]
MSSHGMTIMVSHRYRRLLAVSQIVCLAVATLPVTAWGQLPGGGLPFSPAAGGFQQTGGPYDPQVVPAGAFDQFGAGVKMGVKPVKKPSQKAAPEASLDASATSCAAMNAQTSQGRYMQPDTLNGPQANPHVIQNQDVPMIPRKNGVPTPYQGGSLAAKPTQNTPTPAAVRPTGTTAGPNARTTVNSSVDETYDGALRSLQERLAAVRRGTPISSGSTPKATPDDTNVELEPDAPEPTRAPRFNSASMEKPEQSETIINTTTERKAPVFAMPSDYSSARRPFDGGEMPSVLNGKSPTPTATAPTTARNAGPSSRKTVVDAPAARVADQRGAGGIVEEITPVTVPAATASVGLGGSQALVSRQSPQIVVETLGPRTLTVGKEATYEIVVKNQGDLAAQDVSVTIRVPEFAESTGNKATAGSAELLRDPNDAAAAFYTVEWKIPRVEVRAKESLALRLIPRKSKAFDLGVVWTISPVSSQTSVEVQEPKLALSLAGPPEVQFGQTKTYKLNLSNPGTGDAENVAIHISPLGGADAALTKHRIGTLAAGDSKLIEVELTAKQAGKVLLRAQATGDNGLKAETSEHVLVRRAALSVNVLASKSKYTGTIAGYAVQVANPGDASADNVKVTAAVPNGAKFLSASSGGKFDAETGKVVWTLPALRAGGEQTFEVKCQLNAAGANTLAVDTTAAGDLTASGVGTTSVVALADLSLDVIDPKGPLPIGEEVSFEIQIKNRGTKAAERVFVVAFFEEGIDPVSATGGQHEMSNGDIRFAPIPALAPGATAVMKIKALPKAAGNLAFRAEAVCEHDGSKLAHQSTVLFYGDDAAPTGKAVAGPDDDISASAGQPIRTAGGSSRKSQPVLQAAPGATTAPTVNGGTTPNAGIPLGGPAMTVPGTNTPPATAPLQRGPAPVGSPAPSSPYSVDGVKPTAAATPAGAKPNNPIVLPAYSAPSLPNAQPTGGLLLPPR